MHKVPFESDRLILRLLLHVSKQSKILLRRCQQCPTQIRGSCRGHRKFLIYINICSQVVLLSGYVNRVCVKFGAPGEVLI